MIFFSLLNEPSKRRQKRLNCAD